MDGCTLPKYTLGPYSALVLLDSSFADSETETGTGFRACRARPRLLKGCKDRLEFIGRNPRAVIAHGNQYSPVVLNRVQFYFGSSAGILDGVLNQFNAHLLNFVGINVEWGQRFTAHSAQLDILPPGTRAADGNTLIQQWQKGGG